MSASTISAAVLAAGEARRMGRQKLLLEIDGEPMIRRVAGEVAALSPGEMLIVASVASANAVTEALRGLAVRVVVNERAAEGLGTSIAAAAASVVPATEALLLVQGDQPLVDRSMLATLVEEWRKDRPPFVASSYDGVRTTPVVFSRSVFDELRALGGDRGARGVLDRHAGAGRVVAFPPARGADVDTPEDYRRALDLCARSRKGGPPHG